MKITDLLPDTKQWEALQGVEKDLVHNRRTSRTGAIIAIAAIIVQAIAAIQGPYLANLGQFLANLISGNWDQLFGEGGLDLYEARPDKLYSLTDCVSMQTMKDRAADEALTHDRHFMQEGFRALFRD